MDARDAACDAVRDVIATMRAEVARGRLTLSDMADIAHLSPHHFIRVFREATGTPPGAFQSALRLAEAKRQLAASDIPVTELCFDLGYASLGTFVARFTAGVGLSPSRYRRLISGLVVPAAPTLAEALCTPGAEAFPTPGGGAHVLRGVLAGAPGGGGPAFIGVFPQYLPRGLPLAGTARLGDGSFAIEPVTDGTYAVLAAACPGGECLAAALAHGTGVRVAGAAPVRVTGGRAEPVRLDLRAPAPTDPPVLVALALLLARAMARWEKRAAPAAG